MQQALELNAPNIAHAADDGTVLPLEPPASARLGELRVPALVMVGDADLSSVRARYEYLLQNVPEVTGVRFPDAAHLPSVERPAEFERVVLDWLSERGL